MNVEQKKSTQTHSLNPFAQTAIDEADNEIHTHTKQTKTKNDQKKKTNKIKQKRNNEYTT